MKTKDRWKNPRLLPGMRHEMLGGLSSMDTMQMWMNTQDAGSKFHLPKSVRDESRVRAKEAIADLRRQRQYMGPAMIEEARNQSVVASVIELMHSTWDEAELYSVTEQMTALASRTGMTEFYLPSDLLPGDSGLLFWQSPIGVSEHYTPQTEYVVNPLTGAPTAITYDALYSLFRSADVIPVVAASWRRVEEGVYVVFWTDTEYAVKSLKGLTPKQQQDHVKDLMPLTFEQEQLLPLDEKRPWFTSKDDNRLISTARGRGRNARTLKLAADRLEQNLPVLEQMVRTFTATLLYMRNVEKNRERVYPSRTVSQGMMRQGVPSRIAESPVTVIDMGQPLRYRPPKRREDAEWHWDHRRVVPPYFRYRQYVPATGETREGVFEVSGYIAGPPDAPIRNIDKVFLLGS